VEDVLNKLFNQQKLETHVEDVVTKFTPQLLKVLPMDDIIFVSELKAAGLLPGNLKAVIMSKSTSAEKADYLIDHVVLPSANDDTTSFQTLLDVMNANESIAVKKLAKDIQSYIKE